MYYTGLIQHEPTNSGALIRCVDGPTRSIPGLIHTTPGMIGIRHSDLGKDPATFSLTVMGSNKYLTDPDFKDLPFVTNNRANFADEPVYAVYFKWGSTIAVLGSQTGVTTFVDSDVVWWPTNSVEINYTRPTTFSWGHDRFRPATPTSATSGTAAAAGNRIPAFNDTEGWGDPCKLVDGGTATNPSLWRTPTGGPWTSTELISGTYYPFGYQRGDYAYEDETQPANSPITWTAQRARPNGQNAVTKWDETRKGAISDDGDFFLPATGFRMGGNTNSASPKDGSGDMELLGGRGGAYWTSSTTNNSGSYNITTGSFSAGGVTYAGFSNYNNNYMGLCLRIYSNIVSPAKDLYYSYAIPIRCVPAN
jgi:hypothetical protein